MVILGVDPGLNATGYGVTEAMVPSPVFGLPEADRRLSIEGKPRPMAGQTGGGMLPHVRLITAGDIRPPKTEPLSQRLGVIHAALSTLIGRYHPDTVVLEQLFTHHHHVTTAALMAHARGVACLAAQEHGVKVAEYPPTQVKKSLTGNGRASKEQVARMVQQWLGHADPSWSMDATDALALTIAHAHIDAQNQRVPIGADSNFRLPTSDFQRSRTVSHKK